MSSHSILPIKERLLHTHRSDSIDLLNRLWECRTEEEALRHLEAFRLAVEARMNAADGEGGRESSGDGPDARSAGQKPRPAGTAETAGTT
jgi:hypothetical protein